MLAIIKGTFLGSKSGVTSEGVNWCSTDIYSNGEAVTVRGVDLSKSKTPLKDYVELPCEIRAYQSKLYCSYKSE